MVARPSPASPCRRASSSMTSTRPTTWHVPIAFVPASGQQRSEILDICRPLTLKLERANPIASFQLFVNPKPGNKSLSPTIPQKILDRLTDVAMPKLANEKPPQEFVSALRVHAAFAAMPRVGARERRRRTASGGRVEATRDRCRDRVAKRIRRHIGLLGIGQADAAHGQLFGSRRRLSRHGGSSRRWRRDG